MVHFSFHVGTLCNDASAYKEGLSDTRKLFEVGASLGHKLRLVDIGGGFPGEDSKKISFDQVSQRVNSRITN